MKTPYIHTFFVAFLSIYVSFVSPALADNAETIDRLIQRAEQRRMAIAKTMEQSTVFIYSRGDDGVSMGTGFMVADGYVLSNGHVVDGGSNFYIGGKDFSPVRAEVVDWIDDDVRDFALLRFNPPIKLPILSFNLNIHRTDRVSAWGFPYLVTQFDQGMENIESGGNSNVPPVVYSEGSVSTFLQHSNGRRSIAHTAVISGGNSGGPLINSRGEVVGINTWVATDEGGAATLHASLLAADAVKFLRDLGIEPHMAEGSPHSYSAQNPAPVGPNGSLSSPQNPSPTQNLPRISPSDDQGNPNSSLLGLFNSALEGVQSGQGRQGGQEKDEHFHNNTGLTGDAKEIYPEAINGNADAQTYLGICYLLGSEAPEDGDKAVYWLRKAAAQGNASAQHALGVVYVVEPSFKNTQEGLRLLQAAAKKDTSAAASLAHFLIFGEVNGITRDLETSFRLAQESAKAKESEAYALLAFFYFAGEGVVDQDPQLALEYAQKSNEEALSQAVLSWMHHQGSPLEKNDAKAFSYAQKAMKEDDYLAMGLLGYYYYSGLGTEVDYKKALEYAEMASENFNEMGYFVLASMYAEGEGVQKDAIKAWAYFDMAARKNIESADEKRDALGSNMSSQNLEAAKNLVRSWHEQNGLPFS